APQRPSILGSPAATCGLHVVQPRRHAWGRRPTWARRRVKSPWHARLVEGTLAGSASRRKETAMTVQTLHIPLPEAIVQRLQRVAEATHRPLEEVVVQTICGNLPPALEDLSPALREVVADLPTLNDEALWGVARATLPPQQWRRHQHLLRKAREGTLT